MEEKVNNDAMKGIEEQLKDMSKEDLIKVIQKLQQEGMALYEENTDYKRGGPIARMNFLFRILENKDIFDDLFKETAKSEIWIALFGNKESNENRNEQLNNKD
jgi:uncharacterized protein (DUF111 family)